MNSLEPQTLCPTKDGVDRACIHHFTVVLADDSADDCFFLQRAMQNSSCLRLSAQLHDGIAAINYLRGAGEYADRGRYPVPDLLLLDIQMPGMSGLHVLEWIRRNRAHLPHLRVVMLSGSLDEQNISRALHLGADYLQSKTLDLKDLKMLVRRLELLMAFLRGREPRPSTAQAMGASPVHSPAVRLSECSGCAGASAPRS